MATDFGRDPAFVPAASSHCVSRPSGLQSGVEEIARAALFNIADDMARVRHVAPVNGTYDYFIVEFAGSRIVFKLPWHAEVQWFGGDYGLEVAALSDKAGKAATAINDLLFGLAKDAAALALRTGA